MRHTPVWDSLHSGDAMSQGTPPLTDYPIFLLTRRTLGEMAGGILADRLHAPRGVPLRSAVSRPRNV
jgi:hypothetical protein